MKIILILVAVCCFLATSAYAAEKQWVISYCDLEDTTFFEIEATSNSGVVDYVDISYSQAKALRQHFGAKDGSILRGKVLTGQTLEAAIKAAIK